MKLRQKIKNAKRDLKIFDELPYPALTMDKMSHLRERYKIAEIAYLKHIKDSVSEIGQPIEEATHIKIYADFYLLGELKSPNGRPLTMERIVEFYKFIESTNINSYIKRTAKRSPDEEKTRGSVRYTLHYSTDCTKNKSFCYGLLYEQHYGSDEVYLNE